MDTSSDYFGHPDAEQEPMALHAQGKPGQDVAGVDFLADARVQEVVRHRVRPADSCVAVVARRREAVYLRTCACAPRHPHT